MSGTSLDEPASSTPGSSSGGDKSSPHLLKSLGADDKQQPDTTLDTPTSPQHGTGNYEESLIVNLSFLDMDAGGDGQSNGTGQAAGPSSDPIVRDGRAKNLSSSNGSKSSISMPAVPVNGRAGVASVNAWGSAWGRNSVKSVRSGNSWEGETQTPRALAAHANGSPPSPSLVPHTRDQDGLLETAQLNGDLLTKESQAGNLSSLQPPSQQSQQQQFISLAY